MKKIGHLILYMSIKKAFIWVSGLVTKKIINGYKLILYGGDRENQ